MQGEWACVCGGVTSDCNLVGGSKLEGRFSPYQQLPVK